MLEDYLPNKRFLRHEERYSQEERFNLLVEHMERRNNIQFHNFIFDYEKAFDDEDKRRILKKYECLQAGVHFGWGHD